MIKNANLPTGENCQDCQRAENQRIDRPFDNLAKARG